VTCQICGRSLTDEHEIALRTCGWCEKNRDEPRDGGRSDVRDKDLDLS
jgi:hypothetical protein